MAHALARMYGRAGNYYIWLDVSAIGDDASPEAIFAAISTVDSSARWQATKWFGRTARNAGSS